MTEFNIHNPLKRIGKLEGDTPDIYRYKVDIEERLRSIPGVSEDLSEFRTTVYNRNTCESFPLTSLGIAQLSPHQELCRLLNTPSNPDPNKIFAHPVGSGKTPTLWSVLGNYRFIKGAKIYYLTKKSLLKDVEKGMWGYTASDISFLNMDYQLAGLEEDDILEKDSAINPTITTVSKFCNLLLGKNANLARDFLCLDKSSDKEKKDQDVNDNRYTRGENIPNNSFDAQSKILNKTLESVKEKIRKNKDINGLDGLKTEYTDAVMACVEYKLQERRHFRPNKDTNPNFDPLENCIIAIDEFHQMNKREVELLEDAVHRSIEIQKGKMLLNPKGYNKMVRVLYASGTPLGSGPSLFVKVLNTLSIEPGRRIPILREPDYGKDTKRTKKEEDELKDQRKIYKRMNTLNKMINKIKNKDEGKDLKKELSDITKEGIVAANEIFISKHGETASKDLSKKIKNKNTEILDSALVSLQTSLKGPVKKSAFLPTISTIGGEKPKIYYLLVGAISRVNIEKNTDHFAQISSSDDGFINEKDRYNPMYVIPDKYLDSLRGIMNIKETQMEDNNKESENDPGDDIIPLTITKDPMQKKFRAFYNAYRRLESIGNPIDRDDIKYIKFGGAFFRPYDVRNIVFKERMSPKMLQLLYLIRKNDDIDISAHNKTYKHVIISDTGGIYGSSWIAACFYSLGFGWKSFSKPRGNITGITLSENTKKIPVEYTDTEAGSWMRQYGPDTNSNFLLMSYGNAFDIENEPVFVIPKSKEETRTYASERTKKKRRDAKNKGKRGVEEEEEEKEKGNSKYISTDYTFTTSIVNVKNFVKNVYSNGSKSKRNEGFADPMQDVDASKIINRKIFIINPKKFEKNRGNMSNIANTGLDIDSMFFFGRGDTWHPILIGDIIDYVKAKETDPNNKLDPLITDRVKSVQEKYTIFIKGNYLNFETEKGGKEHKLSRDNLGIYDFSDFVKEVFQILELFNLVVWDSSVDSKIRSSLTTSGTTFFNDKSNNVHGEKCRILILDKDFKEGVDVFDAKYFYEWEVPLTKTDDIQMTGRVNRRCGSSEVRNDDPEHSGTWVVHKYTLGVNCELSTENAQDKMDLTVDPEEITTTRQKKDPRYGLKTITFKEIIDFINIKSVESKARISIDIGSEQITIDNDLNSTKENDKPIPTGYIKYSESTDKFKLSVFNITEITRDKDTDSIMCLNSLGEDLMIGSTILKGYSEDKNVGRHVWFEHGKEIFKKIPFRDREQTSIENVFKNNIADWLVTIGDTKITKNKPFENVNSKGFYELLKMVDQEDLENVRNDMNVLIRENIQDNANVLKFYIYLKSDVKKGKTALHIMKRNEHNSEFVTKYNEWTMKKELFIEISSIMGIKFYEILLKHLKRITKGEYTAAFVEETIRALSNTNCTFVIDQRDSQKEVMIPFEFVPVNILISMLKKRMDLFNIRYMFTDRRVNESFRTNVKCFEHGLASFFANTPKLLLAHATSGDKQALEKKKKYILCSINEELLYFMDTLYKYDESTKTEIAPPPDYLLCKFLLHLDRKFKLELWRFGAWTGFLIFYVKRVKLGNIKFNVVSQEAQYDDLINTITMGSTDFESTAEYVSIFIKENMHEERAKMSLATKLNENIGKDTPIYNITKDGNTTITLLSEKESKMIDEDANKINTLSLVQQVWYKLGPGFFGIESPIGMIIDALLINNLNVDPAVLTLRTGYLIYTGFSEFGGRDGTSTSHIFCKPRWKGKTRLSPNEYYRLSSQRDHKEKVAYNEEYHSSYLIGTGIYNEDYEYINEHYKMDIFEYMYENLYIGFGFPIISKEENVTMLEIILNKMGMDEFEEVGDILTNNSSDFEKIKGKNIRDVVEFWVKFWKKDEVLKILSDENNEKYNETFRLVAFCAFLKSGFNEEKFYNFVEYIIRDKSPLDILVKMYNSFRNPSFSLDRIIDAYFA